MAREWSPELCRNLELRLQHAQKLESVGLMTVGIIHDISNLLTGVLGYADLALAQVDCQPIARECLENIKAAALRAADIARHSLNYASGIASKFESLNLSPVVAALKGLVDVSLSKKTAVIFQLDENLPAILGNATQIHQLAMNLLLNASEALENMVGTVRITTRAVAKNLATAADVAFQSPPEGDMLVCLEVADSGRGMDEATRRKVFDPFYSTKDEGRGLGLMVVERIVTAHSGGVDISSVPGHGTIFRVYFPVANENASSPPSAETVATSAVTGTILVVDDEAIVRMSTKALAETAGYIVFAAESGLEAIEIYRSRHCDIGCVILDMTMPKLDGLQTLMELRKINDKVRAIITSGGYPSGSLKNHPASGNIIGFLQKPYDFNALLETLRDVVGAGNR